MTAAHSGSKITSSQRLEATKIVSELSYVLWHFKTDATIKAVWHSNEKIWTSFASNTSFNISIYLELIDVNLWYYKLWLFDQT